MPVTIRILGRWIATVEGGFWRVLQGPEDIAIALNASRPDIRLDDKNADFTLAVAARTLYPDAKVFDLAAPDRSRPT